MGKKSPIPAGAFVELNIDAIAEGKCRRDFERKLRRAYKELMEYEKETGDTKCKSVVLLKVTISRMAAAKEHIAITHNTKLSTPTVSEVSIVRERGGRLLCQPVGASEFDPDQQVLFDSLGRPIQGVDPETGEAFGDEAKQKDVAGKIRPAVNQ